jgi:ATP-dependent protease ClpP protease subunit
MSREDRIDLIRAIEKERNSRVITYLTGDRSNASAQIHHDALETLYEHLETIGKVDNLDLFLYSRGGEVMAPYRIVRLCREFCKRFGVLIPYRAHSAATQLSLGADEIIMGKMSELTPIDPRTTNPFNPKDETNPKNRIPISVEDVTSFFELAGEDVEMDKQSLVEIFKILTNQVHPLALGNVKRVQNEVRVLARNLLNMHMDVDKKKDRIEKIINKLTRELYAHDYLISREEAKEIGLKVKYPSPNLEKNMWDLYQLYRNYMNLRKPFDPREYIENKEQEFSFPIACIESVKRLNVYNFRGRIEAITTPQGVRLNVQTKISGWEIEEGGN